MAAINVRVTDVELAAIKDRAQMAGVSVADLVKQLAMGQPKDRARQLVEGLERVEDVVNQILDFLPTLAVRGSQTGFSDGTPLPQIWEQEIEAQRVVTTPLSAPTVPNLTPMRTVVTKTGSFEVPDVTPQDYDRVDPP